MPVENRRAAIRRIVFQSGLGRDRIFGHYAIAAEKLSLPSRNNRWTNTLWETRRSLLRKYNVDYFFPARSPIGWTGRHAEALLRFSGQSGLVRLHPD